MSNPAGSEQPTALQRELLELYLSGLTMTAVAERRGVHRNTASRQLEPLLTPELRRTARRHRKQTRGERQIAEVERLRPQAEALLAAGHSIPAMRRQLGVSHPIKQLLVDSISIADRKRWFADRVGQQRSKFSYERKAAVLQEAFRIIGGAYLGQRPYQRLQQRDHPDDWPALSTYEIRGWNWWLEQAGLPPQPVFRGGPLGFSEQQCQQAADRAAAHYQRPYSVGEYAARRRPEDPSAVTLRVRFGHGSWIRALEYLCPQLFDVAA